MVSRKSLIDSSMTLIPNIGSNCLNIYFRCIFYWHNFNTFLKYVWNELWIYNYCLNKNEIIFKLRETELLGLRFYHPFRITIFPSELFIFPSESFIYLPFRILDLPFRISIFPSESSWHVKTGQIFFENFQNRFRDSMSCNSRTKQWECLIEMWYSHKWKWQHRLKNTVRFRLSCACDGSNCTA